MSSDQNNTNYQQKQNYNSGASDLISSSGDADVKSDSVQIETELDNYHVTTSMPHTKTMILQSTGEFQYVNQPSVDSHEYDSPGPAVDEVSESGDGYDTVSSGYTNLSKNERNGQPLIVMDSGVAALTGHFSVGLASLPPPPPPTVTITGGGINNIPPHANHLAQQTIIVSRPQSSNSPTPSITNYYGRLSYKDDILYINDQVTDIGRNSSTSTVHFHVGKNSFVSRKHLRLLYDHSNNEFYLMCLSKNGVFVNDAFQRKSSEPLKLPKTCTIRFPSTSIRILFESFTDHLFEPPPMKNNKTVENSNVIYAPLKISIPEHDKKSPFPSPTGTISAANSCPTSPRHNYQDYHHLAGGSAYSSYNHHNNNHLHTRETGSSSHGNSSHNFENDLFLPPSTSSFNEFEKPPYSYAQLIVQSISASPERQLTLSGIYSFISKNYPYYRKEANKGWQNSIRHNLSLNRYFIKVARSQDEPGKGSFWRIDPNSEAKLIDQSYKKRRHRGSQCFRAPYGMPRSAPVSPSHMNEYNDNSADNSPVHIVLQSAPGSPGAYHTIHQDNHSGEEISFSAQNQLLQGLSSFNHSTTNQVGPLYVNSSVASNVLVNATTSIPATGQTAIVKRAIQSNTFHQSYDDQALSSPSSSALNHSNNQHQAQKHHATIEEDSDDDDEYNHNTSKRHKFETDD